MAISHVRTTGKSSSAGHSQAVSFSVLPTAGDAIAVWFWGSGSTSATGESVSDNQGVGNTYSLMVACTEASPLRGAIYVCPSIGATSGTFTVTATMNTSIVDIAAVATEFTQLVTPVDKTSATNNGASTSSPTTGTTAATTQADEVALAVVVPGGSANPETITAAGSYVADGTETNNSTLQAGQGCYLILSATGTQVETWTLGTAAVYCAAIATVKGAAAGTDPFPAGYGHPFGARGQTQMHSMVAGH